MVFSTTGLPLAPLLMLEGEQARLIALAVALVKRGVKD